jgi:hypothetical protein
LDKALKGKAYKFQLGKMVQQTTPEVIVNEGVEEVVEVSMIDEFGRPVVKWENLAKKVLDQLSDPIDIEIVKSEIYKELNQLKKEVLPGFEKSLKARKRQIDVEQAVLNNPYVSRVTGQTYDSYLDYLSSPTELSGPQEDKTSILTMDSKSYNGSFYYDVKTEFTTFEAQQGPNVEPEVPFAPPPPNTNPTEMSDSPKQSVVVDAGYMPKNRRRPTTPKVEEQGEEIKNQCKTQ